MQESNYWTRLARRRLSRRTVLSAGGTAALGGAAALVVGCGSNGGGGAYTGPLRTPGPDGTPPQGGRVVWGRGVEVGGIDPHVDLAGLDIGASVYSYLYGWNPATEEVILNNFAEEFEQPDPDHLEFIWALRPGTKIQPGGPGEGEDLTSHDCKESFVRRGTSLTAPDKRFPQRIAGSAQPDDLAAALETPDDYTFRFTMREPFVPAIREMANPTWAIVPAKVIDEIRPNLSQNAHGSGPFRLEEFRGQERIVLQRHPEYFLNPRPWLDEITHIVIPENSSLLSAFRNGQHDINGAFLAKSDADDLMENENFVVNRSPSLFYPVLHLKMKPPFDDIRVRQAINLALDRDELIDRLQDGEGEYNGPIQWAQGRWALPQEELREFYRHDADEARRLLDEAGYANGFSARMKLPRLEGPNIVGDMAIVVKAQLERVGINFELDEVELGAFIGSTLLPGNFDVAFFPNLPYDEPDRPLSFYHTRGVSGSGNWTGYTNDEVDALIDAQEREFDEQERIRIVHEAQRLILEQHGPQLTLTGGYGYSARWHYVHFPGEEGFEEDEGGPFGTGIWTARE